MAPKEEPAVGAGGGIMQLTGLDAADDAMGVPEAAEPAEPPAPKEPVAEMPEEPAETEQHLKVSFRLPSGQRVTRRFRPDDRVEIMFAVASAIAQQPPSLIDLATQFPKRLMRDVE